LNAAAFLPPVKISGIDPSIVIPVSVTTSGTNPAVASGLPTGSGISFWTNATTSTGTGSLIGSLGNFTLPAGFYRIHYKGALLTASGLSLNLCLGLGFATSTPAYSTFYTGGPFNSVAVVNSNPTGYPATATPLVQATYPSGTLGTLFDYVAIVYIPTPGSWTLYYVLAYSNTVTYVVSIVGEATVVE
jgi:hypothetical protein